MKKLACVCVALLWVVLGAARGGAQNQDETEVVRTDLVNVYVTVTDSRGRSVPGLTKGRFEVFDNKARQQIAHFSDEKSPLSLGVIYDMTGLGRAQVSRTLRTIRQFARDANGEGDFFLLAFDGRGTVSATFVPEADQILDHTVLTNAGETASLYDVMYRAVERLSAGHFQKKALLVISDGQSRNSQRTAREVRDRLRESEVKVFAVGGGDPYGESLADLGAFVLAGGTARKGGPESLPDVEAAVGRAILDELTRASGGYAHFSFLTTEPQFDEACSRIAGELRQQYVIGFYPAAPADDAGWHKLEVRVNAPRRRGELSLSYRDRYRLGKR